jgi:tetratricopeptide (TPR) repeat protein
MPGRTHLEGASQVAAFSPDGRLVAAGGPNYSVLLFDGFTGKQLRPLRTSRQRILLHGFTDDSKRVLVDSSHFEDSNHELSLWDAQTGEKTQQFDVPSGWVQVADVSPDGRRLAAYVAVDSKQDSKPSGEMRVWDVATGKLLQAWAMPPLEYPMTSTLALVFFDGAQSLALREWNGKILAWSIASRDLVKPPENVFAKFERETQTSDGRRLLEWRGGYVIQAPLVKAELQRRRALAHGDPAWHAEMAASAERDKQWFAAAFHLGFLLRCSPDDVELRCRRARAYLGLQWWPQARADADKAVRLGRKSVEPRVTRAQLEYRQGDLKQAHADLASAAAVAPDDPAVAAWQAFLDVVDGRGEKAAAAEKRMLDRLEILSARNPQLVAAAIGGMSGASAPPASEAAPVWPASSWPRLEEELTRCLADKGRAVSLLRLRGEVRGAQGMWDEALADFREATALGPKDALAWKGVVCASWRDRRFGQSGDSGALDTVLRLDPKAWEFWYLRGLLYSVSQQHEPALRAFTRALEDQTDFAPALRERGTTHAALGQWTEAVRDLARAAELTGPADASVWGSLALAQLGRGDTAAYRTTCGRMLDLFGRTPVQVWAGGAFAAPPGNLWGVTLALHVADRAARPRPDAADVIATCSAIRPDALTDWHRLVPLTVNSSDEIRGKVFCRAGRYEDAVKLLEPLRTAGAPEPLVTLYLALAEHGRGHPAKAKGLLHETTAWLDSSPKATPKRKNSDWLAWTERVQIEQLRHELKALLPDKAP